ncbi:MAG: flagellar basal body rod C-terminal domain-containing protein [Acetobacteraceae bacterium]
MSLDSIISIASSGVADINKRLDLVSQNVANATTPGYAEETEGASDVTAGGIGMGVRSGVATRVTDAQVQSSLLAQDAIVSGQTVTQTALSAINATQGTTEAGNDLASQLGALQDAFTALSATPDSTAQQLQVVSAADTLAQGINQMADAYQNGRQSAQDSAVAEVSTLNQTLAQIGTVSQQIISLTQAGQSTADLESQRDGLIQTATQIAGINFLPQSDGDVLAVTQGGQTVNLHATTGPFSLADATLSPDGPPAPALMLSGQDVTAQITSGSLGANLTLRDTTLPAGQAGLDEFSKTLADRMNDQGLALFTDQSGNVPNTDPSASTVQSGYVGFANEIQVNSQIIATPSLVRDGLQNAAGLSAGASTVPPNPTGAAGYTTLINNIVNNAFGPEAVTGDATTTYPPIPQSGLGASGTIALPFQPPATLAGFASDLVTAQSEATSNATSDLATSTAYQGTLQAALQSATGVSIDTEMSNMIALQNAYGANAKVLDAAEAMWTALLAVLP